MTTPTAFAEQILQSVDAELVDEDASHVTFRTDLSNQEVRDFWAMARRQPPPFVSQVFIVEADSDGAYEDGYVPRPDEIFIITLVKVTLAGELRLLFARSLASIADALAGADIVRIAEMQPNEAFCTLRSRFQLWTTDPAHPFAPGEPLKDPRNLCVDLTGKDVVPSDIRPWILSVPPNQAGSALTVWSALAAPRLLSCICNQVSLRDDKTIYHFSGPPFCALTLSAEELLPLFERLTRGANWVFNEGRDAETRHLLLSNEWARSHRSGAPAHLGDDCVESANSAYNAYVKSNSKDMLKALAELRKAVLDETQKISQRAQDLSGALWKDIAVSATPFVMKFFSDTSKISNMVMAGLIAIAASAYLAFSYKTQTYINERYFKAQKGTRSTWNGALATALSVAEIKEFSDDPISQSIADYDRVKQSVRKFYTALIFILVAFALYDFFSASLAVLSSTPQQAPQSSSGTAEQRPPSK